MTHVVVGGSVQARAGTSKVVGSRSDIGVSGVTWGWHLIATNTLARQAILCSIVWVLCVVWGGTLVVCVERASRRASVLEATRLLTLCLAEAEKG